MYIEKTPLSFKIAILNISIHFYRFGMVFFWYPKRENLEHYYLHIALWQQLNILIWYGIGGNNNEI